MMARCKELSSGPVQAAQVLSRFKAVLTDDEGFTEQAAGTAPG